MVVAKARAMDGTPRGIREMRNAQVVLHANPLSHWYHPIGIVVLCRQVCAQLWWETMKLGNSMCFGIEHIAYPSFSQLQHDHALDFLEDLAYKEHRESQNKDKDSQPHPPSSKPGKPQDKTPKLQGDAQQSIDLDTLKDGEAGRTHNRDRNKRR